MKLQSISKLIYMTAINIEMNEHLINFQFLFIHGHLYKQVKSCYCTSASTHTNTHTHMYICVCVHVNVYDSMKIMHVIDTF